MCEYTAKAVKEKKWDRIYILEWSKLRADSLTNEADHPTIYFETIKCSNIMDVNPLNSGTWLRIQYSNEMYQRFELLNLVLQ